MRSDLAGRLRNTKLPFSHALQPVHEAVINSLDAIEEADRDGHVSVMIERQATLDLSVHGNVIADPVAFEIADDGVGFTDSNFESFETLDSMAKAARGGKGIGRLMWLKAFDHVAVESVFALDGASRLRRFTFGAAGSGISDHTVEALPERRPCRTRVRLQGFKEGYRRRAPKGRDVIAREILQHSLAYFVLRRDFDVSVGDEGGSLSLRDLFEQEYLPAEGFRSYEVEGEPFEILDILVTSSASTGRHKLVFCANGREVVPVTLSEVQLPHIGDTLSTDSGEAIYRGYVQSPVLDSSVDQERVAFNLSARGDLGLYPGPSWDAVEEETVSAAGGFLEQFTTEAREAAIRRVEDFVSQEAPQYRFVMHHYPEEVASIPASVSNEKLDLKLHTLRQDLRARSRAQAAEHFGANGESSSEDGERTGQLLAQLNDVLKSDLAELVVQRRTTLDLFHQLLGLQTDGTLAAEERIHEVFFPPRATSDEVDYDDHNLWMLDERLAFHQFLASDLRLSSHRPVAVAAASRPDIVVYNTPIAFVKENPPTSSIVIVEFKRPERDDYSDDSNPIRQVLDYVRLIREGGQRDAHGETVQFVDGTPFYCYVVATMTPKLRREAETMGFSTTPDRKGFFSYNSVYAAYIEVVSFRKVLEDAIQRNSVFFDKLQMPLSGWRGQN